MVKRGTRQKFLLKSVASFSIIWSYYHQKNKTSKNNTFWDNGGVGGVGGGIQVPSDNVQNLKSERTY